MTFIKKWWLAASFITITIVSLAIIIIPTSIAIRGSLSGLAHDIMINISAYTLDKSKNYLIPAQKAAELTRFLADSSIVGSRNPEPMIKYFYHQMDLYPQFTSVYYGTTKGEFFMASRSNPKVPGGFYTKIIRIADGERTCTLSWSDPDHKTIGSRDDPEDRYDPRQRPWFIDALMDNGVVWTSPYLFSPATSRG